MLIYYEHELVKPLRAHEGDAGVDLKTAEACTIPPGIVSKIPTGVYVAIPEGHVGMIFPRSSIGIKKGLMLANTVGIVDSGYRGEIFCFLRNVTDEYQTLEACERFAQLVVVPCDTSVPVFVHHKEDLGKTERGEGGFGSSGKH